MGLIYIKKEHNEILDIDIDIYRDLSENDEKKLVMLIKHTFNNLNTNNFDQAISDLKNQLNL